MELGRVSSDGDPYAGYVVDDSDLEYSDCSEESSGDEIIQLKGSRSRSFERSCGKVKEAEDSEDEFEKEMEAEATHLLEMATEKTFSKKGSKQFKISESLSSQGLEDPSTLPQAGGSVSAVVDSSTEGKINEKEAREKIGGESKYYDDIYFDSSDEEGDDDERTEGITRTSREKVPKLSNDELFYDPDMDEDDERWVQRQRMAYHNVHLSSKLVKEKKKSGSSDGVQSTSTSSSKHESESNPSFPNSDAVLNCPACLSTLCLDCQRHEVFTNQYRAMFVLNCKIIKDEVLKYKPKPNKKSRRRTQRDLKKGDNEMPEEGYNPVHCSVCNTEVAVYDKDEIFHFFNVLASAP